MSFTRDYVITTPIDHTLNASWPDYDRRTKQDLQDRLATIVSGFVSGETVLGILNLPFIAGATPSTVTDQIQLYGKAVAGKTELHSKSEDGVESQLTSGGALNITAASLLASVGPLIHPVGSVVTLGVSTNPATLFGFGTWTAITGKVIVGIDSGTFTPLDKTGGEETHTLTLPESPAHTHASTIAVHLEGSNGTYVESSDNASTSGSQVVTSDSAGGGGAHNNLQPYIVKYVWQRTA